MPESREPIGRQIAQAVRAFETRRTGQCRQWLAAFINEDTVVIALHSCLTPAENALAQSPAGAAQVVESHRRLLAAGPAALSSRVERLAGVGVLGTIVEVEPTTGGLVYLFVTNAVREAFALGPGRRRAGGATRRAPRRHGRRPRPTRNNRMRNPGMIAPS